MTRFTLDAAIVGSQKCGTSTLFDTLVTHPDIVGSQPKEPQFFSRSPDWQKELDSYARIFDRANSRQLTLEASTTYTYAPLLNPMVWRDLHAHNPEMRILYIVRHPIDRIVSAYMHAYERGFTDEPDMWRDITYRLPLLSTTRYATQISPYIDTFGRDQVHICLFDDLRHRRQALLTEVAAFLGVAADGFTDQALHSNSSSTEYKPHRRFDNPSLGIRIAEKVSYRLWRRLTDNSHRHFSERPSLTDTQRNAVLSYLSAEIDALERLTERDLSHWR